MFKTELEFTMFCIILFLLTLLVIVWIYPSDKDCESCKKRSNKTLQDLVRNIHDNVARENRERGKAEMQEKVVEMLSEVMREEWDAETWAVLKIIKDAIERY